MKMDQQIRTTTSRLFNVTVVDAKKDEIEEKYDRGYQHYQNLISGLSDKETIDTLTSAINRDKAQEEMISLGMITIILTEPHNAEKVYQDLRMLNRDGFTSVTTNTSQLILERYTRLHDVARCQMLWLVREMVRNMVPSGDTLCWNLMRHAASGDVSPKNLYLIENLLDIYQENRKWLEKFPWLLASVVYSFLRFIEDHASSSLTKLRQKEVIFVVSLLREKFLDCLVIGRDLVRLLQNVSRIPEIELLWKDLLQNPTSLAPGLTGGILQLLQTRTSRRFLQSRLTPDMEKKMVFFTSNVRFGNHKRYQEWFQKQYLATPESQSLRSDLIRFIVGVIHPTNELLCSDIIPRWAVIGWLITTCTSNIALANAKLALFYDWLFFDSVKDNIMNIEPAILVMNNSQKTHAAVTASLLDFLCRIIPNFYPPLMDAVRAGVFCSLSQILEKRVLPSLLPLFDNPKLDRELRSMIKDTFSGFCEPPIEGGKIDEPIIKEEPVVTTADRIERVKTPPPLPPVLNNHDTVNSVNTVVEPIEPIFSDEETDPPPAKIIKLEMAEEENPQVRLSRVDDEQPEERTFSDVVKTLDKEFRDIMLQLHKEKNETKRCSVMEKLTNIIAKEGSSLDADSLTNIAVGLNMALEAELEGLTFPKDDCSPKNIEESTNKPLFVLFRGLTQASDSASKRIPFFTILTELRSSQPRVGYLLFYYLQVQELNKDNEKSYSSSKGYLYKEYCRNLEKKFEDCLICDLETCQEEDLYMFCWLIPIVYKDYPRFCIGNEKLLHLIVSTVDASQLQELVCKVLQGSLTMFRADTFVSLATSSLSWETFEQFCLWQLAIAHNIPLDVIMNVLPKLDFNAHSEALTTILLLLRREKPSLDLLKPIFCRELKPVTDMFVITILQAWCTENCDDLGSCVADLLTSRCPTASPSKRKRGQGQGLGARTGVSPPSAERILAHLDRARNGCKPMFKVDSMQRVLQIAQAACTDTQRGLYRSLFALLEEDEPAAPSGRSAASTSKGRGRKTASSSSSQNSGSSSNSYSSKHRNASNRTNLKELSDTSASSSEEEEVIRPRNAKKRKKTSAVPSDSD